MNCKNLRQLLYFYILRLYSICCQLIDIGINTDNNYNYVNIIFNCDVTVTDSIRLTTNIIDSCFLSLQPLILILKEFHQTILLLFFGC